MEKTNETVTVYLPKNEFFAYMQLFDESGVEIAKTNAGEKYGGQFKDLKVYSWDLVDKRGHNTGGSDRPNMILPHTNTSQARELPALQELFQIKKPGNYKLSVQFQIFKRVENGTNSQFKVVRFPLAEILATKNPSS